MYDRAAILHTAGAPVILRELTQAQACAKVAIAIADARYSEISEEIAPLSR